jgi:hypothetical protein
MSDKLTKAIEELEEIEQHLAVIAAIRANETAREFQIRCTVTDPAPAYPGQTHYQYVDVQAEEFFTLLNETERNLVARQLKIKMAISAAESLL